MLHQIYRRAEETNNMQRSVASLLRRCQQCHIFVRKLSEMLTYIIPPRTDGPFCGSIQRRCKCVYPKTSSSLSSSKAFKSTSCDMLSSPADVFPVRRDITHCDCCLALLDAVLCHNDRLSAAMGSSVTSEFNDSCREM